MSEYSHVSKDIVYIRNEISSESTTSVSMNQPLTLDEVQDLHTYPLLIHRLIEYSSPKDEFDFIVLVIHALMIESGFQMDAENNQNLTIARKSSTFYVIRYRHKLCEDERIRCSLAIMKTNSLVTIDGVVNSLSQACGKLSFDILNYLYTPQETTILNTLFPYHNLRTLSRLFKDNLANRLLCKLLEESGQRSNATLIGLPNEIKIRLAKYLPIQSFIAVQATCRDIYSTFSDNLLWHDLCIRDFGKAASISCTSDNSPHEKDWYRLYQIIYTQKQTTRRHQIEPSTCFNSALFPWLSTGHPAHRLLFSDVSTMFHPFPLTIYRPIPPGIIRVCTTSTQQTQSSQQQQAQHHICCQSFFGSKWVVIIAAATMIPLRTCFHPVWLR